MGSVERPDSTNVSSRRRLFWQGLGSAGSDDVRNTPDDAPVKLWRRASCMLWLRGGRREGAASLLVLPPLPRLCTLVPGPLETSLCALELLVLPCIILRISWPLAPPETRNGGYTENAEGLLLAQPLVVRSRSCACMSSVSTSRATWNLVFLLTYPVVFSAVYGSKSRIGTGKPQGRP